MRIAFVASHAPSLINFRGALIASLSEAGHEVLAFSPNADEATIARLAELGAEHVPYPLQRTGTDPQADIETLRALTRAFVRLRPDVVFCYTVKPVVWGILAATLAGVPRRVAMVTGLGHAFIDSEDRKTSTAAVVHSLYAVALRFAHRVIFHNEDDLRLFTDRKLVPDDGRAVVVNGSGVDIERFEQAPFPEGPLRFLLVARLLKEKGILEYVEAARIVRAKYPDVVFELVGPADTNPSGIQAEQARAWHEEGLIEYTGPLRDVRPAFARCHVYVLPSWREGMPRTNLEAMGTGRPLLTTDVAGCRQTVHKGQNGKLVPARDPQALADACEWFIQHADALPAMGNASRQLALAHFDVRPVNKAMRRHILGSGHTKKLVATVELQLAIKRLIDIVGSATGLVALSPLLAGIVALELKYHGWPPFFLQDRPGKGGRIFRMLKFRSMTDARDAQGQLLPDAQRLTRFGEKLRSSSLDELPELWNVLRGDMSLVGPRPLLVSYLERYTDEQARRHTMRPGITGLAQVSGRNAISWDERFGLDVEYIDNWSLWADLKILIQTVAVVLDRSGISAEGSATMPEFTGNEELP